ncbi:MAG TPA: FHA domain-containing protein [Gemmataceae bacterium]|nr:FHA domain-containing protein [Gemmataceae bacterium]
MLAKLLESGTVPGQRHEIAVTKEEFLIGRGADCDLRLGGSAISRHHCLLRIRPGEVTLADLGSANGTFVNDQRIRSQTTVNHGDVIGVGDQRFMLELHGSSGIDWGAESGANRDMPTFRGVKPAPFNPLPKTGGGQGGGAVDTPQKDKSHPPGEAGG